jgi:hypothetical protein
MAVKEADDKNYLEDRFHYNVQTADNFKKWLMVDGRLTSLGMIARRSHVRKGLSIMDKIPQQGTDRFKLMQDLYKKNLDSDKSQ